MSADRCPYCASTYHDHVAAVRNAGWCGNAAVRGLYCGPPEPRERPALRLVHDPDTGCDGGHGCKFYDDHRRICEIGADNDILDDPCQRSGTPAPPWCPLRAGDVVVTAGKDGG